MKKDNDFLNLASLYVPTYQITTSKVPVAIIFAPGNQLIVRKLPARSKYFVDPDWGLFEIKSGYVHFMNKTPVYFFDTRNQNPFSPALLAELKRWADRNQITKLNRRHVALGIKLRGKSKKELDDLQQSEMKGITVIVKDLQKDIALHNEKVAKIKEDEDAGNLEGDSGELAPISEIQTNYLIIKQLATESYITKDDALILEERIRNGTIDFEGIIDYLKETRLLEVSESLPDGLDMVAENFHTYEPKDAINIIKMLSKLNKGFQGMRTTKPKNWFPATYILFGMVGIMMLLQFAQGGIDVSGIFGGLGFP